MGGAIEASCNERMGARTFFRSTSLRKKKGTDFEKDEDQDAVGDDDDPLCSRNRNRMCNNLRFEKSNKSKMKAEVKIMTELSMRKANSQATRMNTKEGC